MGVTKEGIEMTAVQITKPQGPDKELHCPFGNINVISSVCYAYGGDEPLSMGLVLLILNLDCFFEVGLFFQIWFKLLLYHLYKLLSHHPFPSVLIPLNNLFIKPPLQITLLLDHPLQLLTLNLQ